MNQKILKVICSRVAFIGTIPIRLLPLKKNRILFTGLTGGEGYDYSCNHKYIYEYLRQHNEKQYEYVWVVKNPSEYGFLVEEGVKVVKHFTLSSIPMLLTSKVVITNGSYVPWFPFRKKQYVINTWHGGGAYKKVELETDKKDWATRKMLSLCARNINLFLASCEIQEGKMIRLTYRYCGEVLREGTPRNDRLIQGDIADMRERVRSRYNIGKETKIVLYAPTYRFGKTPVVFDCDKLIEQLQADGSKWVCMSRYHRYQTQDMNVRVEGENKIDVTDYPDMQELLAAADVLITDYSSCVWDYSFLERPCILYVPDKEEYLETTGFYVGIDSLPFPQVTVQDELVEQIKKLQGGHEEYEAYLEGIKVHWLLMGAYESGHATQAVANKIEEIVYGTGRK